MRCPYCGYQDSKVIDSRDVDGSIRRRRECLNPECSGRFTTYERLQAAALWIVKKDRRREPYSREKLLAGVRKACDKRPLSPKAIDALADDVETLLHKSNASEVPSSTLGEVVMDRLRDLDPIAYVRFASVYRQFADLDALKEELEALASGARPRIAQLPMFEEPELAPPSLRLRPAAPNSGTRTRRQVRPVQTPTPLSGQAPAPREEPKRDRRAR